MLSGLTTLAALLAFVGVVFWAFDRRNTARFEEAASLPLNDDATETGVHS